MAEKLGFKAIRTLGLPSLTDIGEALAFLAVEVALKADQGLRETLAQWLIRAAFSYHLGACHELIYLGGILARVIDGPLSIQMITLIEMLLCRGVVDGGDSSLALKCLLKIAVLMDTANENSCIFSSANHQARSLFLESVASILSRFERFPDPDLRAASARILWLWEKEGSLPEQSVTLLESFRQDPRARVRNAATGAGE